MTKIKAKSILLLCTGVVVSFIVTAFKPGMDMAVSGI